MKRMKQYLLGTCLLTATLLAMPFAHSASESQILDHYAENGRIDRVDLEAGHLVVGDGLFAIASGAIVYASSGTRATLDSLQKGMRIAFNLTFDATRSPSITEIWILSSN